MFLAVAACVALAGRAQAANAAQQGQHLMERGLAQMRAGASRDAVASFSAAIASKTLRRPDMVRAVYDRGVAYDALGDTAAAIADYSAAIRLDMKFAPALNNRANAYRRTGRMALARRDYLAALKCPDVSREYPSYGLGQLAEAAGEPASARDYYHQALAANPAFAVAAQRLVAIEHQSQTVVTPVAASQRRSTSATAHPPSSISAPVSSVSVRQPGPLLRKAIDDPAKMKRRTLIQLGAYRDEAVATAAWNIIRSHTGDTLLGLTPIIASVDLPGKGRYWRLRVEVAGRQEAYRRCETLVQQGQACIVAGTH